MHGPDASGRGTQAGREADVNRARTVLFSSLAFCLGVTEAGAAEMGFNIYPMGSLAFGAGATPPPGFYVTPSVGYYQASIGGNVTVGRTLVVDLDLKFWQPAVNLLYVPEATVFGGHVGFSANVPIGYLDLTANATIGPFSGSRETDGWGFGDLMLRGQIGWTHGHFSHTFYLTGWLPTGRYEPGFAPNIGLNRPAIDGTWAFSYTEPTTMLELSMALGVTFNATNTETDYQTGIEGHLEWALGRKIGQQLTLGVAGYHYRQLTGDSGSGAVFGSFIGRNNGIGPGLSYATQIDGRIVVFSARHYWEYAAARHFEGTLSIASVTMRF
jgi:hypothetical protein